MSSAPWAATVAHYREPRRLASLWQLANTLLPLASVWYLTYRSLAYPYWVTLLLSVVGAGLRVRLFALMHDCGHRSFFRSRRANDLVGAALGVLTWTPYLYWRRFHAMHHATSGNLDQRGWDMLTLTVREYRALPRWRRVVYRLFRNPLFMLIVAANYYFLIRHRFTLTVPRSWRRERRSVHATNLALLAVVLAGWATIGLGAYFLVEAPALLLGHAAGFWLFYVQHQHEAAYWRRDGGWDQAEAALHGSSYFRLPRALQWFTANIGFHHVHHLSSRIPNYNLPRCHDAEPGLRGVFTLTLGQSLRCARMNLWDEERQRMVSFADVAAGTAPLPSPPLRGRGAGGEGGNGLHCAATHTHNPCAGPPAGPEMDCIAPRHTHSHGAWAPGRPGNGLHCACKLCTHPQPLTPGPSPRSTGARGESHPPLIVAPGGKS